MTDLVSDREELSVPVRHERENHLEVVERLLDTLEDYEGYGLSANQIGVQNSRTCVVTVTEDIMFVNPQIVNRRDTTYTKEGCLSFPGERVRTKRNVWVEVEADAWFRQSVGEWNEIGGRLEFGPDFWKPHQEENPRAKKSNKDYLESIAVQHEIDHLNGKTIFDRKAKRQPFEKSNLDDLGRNDKVHVENSDGEDFDVKWKYASKKVGDGGPWTLLNINEN